MSKIVEFPNATSNVEYKETIHIIKYEKEKPNPTECLHTSFYLVNSDNLSGFKCRDCDALANHENVKAAAISYCAKVMIENGLSNECDEILSVTLKKMTNICWMYIQR